MSMISIIVPVLNEEKALPATLQNINSQTGSFEVIVVDGGSNDGTCRVLRNYPQFSVIDSERGRATQMNAGAQIAKGEWLLFLHADTLLPEQALTLITALSGNNQIQAGCFHQQFSDNLILLRLISWLHNWRCRRSRIIYGDQAMFIRRRLFLRLHGFPKQAILEDIAFSEKLVKVTRPVLLKDKVITNSRKFVKRGIFRCFIEVLCILVCYELRLPIMTRGFFSPVR